MRIHARPHKLTDFYVLATHFAHEITYHINCGGDFEFTAGGLGIGIRFGFAAATGNNEGQQRNSRSQSNSARDELYEAFDHIHA